MKKGAFPGLLYREWVLIKKHLIVTLITSLSVIILAFLVVLSFRYGNLALLDEELKAAVFGDFVLVVKALPVLAVCVLVGAPAEAAVRDADIKWERFRRTTPVSCLRLALAKYAVTAALTLAAAGGGIGTMALMCSALGAEFTEGDAAVALALLAAVVVFCVAMQVGVTLFRSSDKAGLTVAVVMCACLFPIIAANRDIFTSEGSGISGMDRLYILTDRLAGALPAVPLVIAAALAIGLTATTMIYKRREK